MVAVKKQKTTKQISANLHPLNPYQHKTGVSAGGLLLQQIAFSAVGSAHSAKRPVESQAVRDHARGSIKWLSSASITK